MKITPPNGDGICSFGHSLFYNPTAARTAKKVVAMVDPRLIWTHGDQIRVSEIDHLVEAPPEEPASVSEFIALPDPQEFEIADVIGAYCASLINDGDTIEIGTGTTSEQTWAHLHTKNDLGVDSEIIVPQTVELVRQGNITGKNRSESKGKVITSCLMAYGGPETDKALEFTNDNPTFEFHDISFQCNVPRIARQRSMVSINAAVAVDLLGQVVIDHIGPLPISGAGGQPEYLIGTHYSEGGRSITTLRSVTKGGTKSCIVPQLEQGSVVSIPAFYVDYLITENGIVNLENKTRRERAEAIISIANPEFQEELRKAAKTLFWP
jgi:4-hydroxybutyrate CoA-transferase